MGRNDDLVDAALMVRGLRTAEEAAVRLPSILAKLREVAGAVRRLRPNRRRTPDLDHALDCAYRSTMDAPIGEVLRAEILRAIGGLKALVGPSVPPWESAPPSRRRRSPRRPAR